MEHRKSIRILAVSAVFFSVLALVFLLWQILLPFLFSYILLFALKPLVNELEQRGVKHVFSVLIVFFCSFGGFVLLLVLIIPILINNFIEIQKNLSEYSRSFNTFITNLQSLFHHYSSVLSFFIPEGKFIPTIERYLNSFLNFFIQRIPSLLSTLVVYSMVIPFATFFLLLDEQRITKQMIRIVPNRYFEITLNLLYSLNLQFGLILRGMSIYVVIISILYSLGLWLIGLHYPIIAGVIAGVSNLIPYAGPIVAIIVAFFISVMTGSPNEIYLSIIFVSIVVQLLDNVIVQPIVMAKSSNLHPLFVLFLVMLGSAFGGFIGMFIVVPLVSLLQIVVKILYAELKRPPRPDFSLYKDVQPGQS